MFTLKAASIFRVISHLSPSLPPAFLPSFLDPLHSVNLTASELQGSAGMFAPDVGGDREGGREGGRAAGTISS